jgi:hypothetical protein
MQNAISIPVMEKWTAQFATAAEPYRGQEAELVFAAAMLEHRLTDDPPGLVKRLIEEHTTSPELKPIVEATGMLSRGMDEGEFRAMLQNVIDRNPVVAIKAQAFFSRAMSVKYDRGASDDAKAQMEQDFANVIALLPEDDLLSMRARGPSFEKERLQIGMKAPEIVGKDLFGETFQLSDYRGKVVMLDFWGDW